MKTQTKCLKDKLETAVHSANIPNLVSFKFLGSCNKHGQYLCFYEYHADCWDQCKAEYATKGTKYDFFAAHGKQAILERNIKKLIATAIKHIAHSLDIAVRLRSGNDAHHDKLDFQSDLFRRTGHVTLNM